MHPSRLTALLTATAAAVTLGGCSSDDAEDGGSSAHVTACRTYVLEVAGQDTRSTNLLTRAARTSSWENDMVNSALNAVQVAAKDAGLVEGLSQDDFDTFSALIDQTATAYARTNPNGGMGITRETATDFQAAAEAVRTACEAS